VRFERICPAYRDDGETAGSERNGLDAEGCGTFN
jgi:hypothetical protein